MNTFKSRTLIAALLLLTLVLTACSTLQASPDPLTTIPTTGAPAPLLTVHANGESIAAQALVLSSLNWTSHGWLAGDGMPVDYRLPTIAADLPRITMGDDFTLIYKENCTFSYLTIYNEAFEKIHPELMEPEDLESLKAGKYYVSITVHCQGDYIESEKKYESSQYNCVFVLSVT